MKRLDQGLGAVGLLVLFAALSLILGIGLPIIKSEAALKVSDWLGFSGNMITAVFAGGAAVVAWLSAQRQLRHAAQQNSVIAYGSLREVLAAINDDAITNADVGTMLGMIEHEGNTVPPERMLDKKEMELELIWVKRCVQELAEAHVRLQNDRANPWGGPAERLVRERLVDAVGTYVALAGVKFEMLHGQNAISGKEFVDMFRDVGWKSCNELYEQFRRMTKAEMDRVYAMMDEHFAGFKSSA